MPHHKSCKKRLKQSLRQRLINRQERAATRTSLKTFRAAGASEAGTTPEQLRDIYSVLDVQARKGIIPRKRAARLKARMAALTASAPTK